MQMKAFEKFLIIFAVILSIAVITVFAMNFFDRSADEDLTASGEETTAAEEQVFHITPPAADPAAESQTAGNEGPSSTVKPGPQTEAAQTSAPLNEDEALDRIKKLIAPVEAGSLDEKYMIRVFKDRQLVCVYTDDGSGKFLNLVHAFNCCTALAPHETPAGHHKIGIKHTFGYMMDGSYGQFCSEFLKTFYFHGVPSYNGSQEAGVRWNEFNNLGNPASHGCIRLTAKDAKWIYDYCKEGTPVDILEDSTGYELPDKVDFVKMKEGGPSWDPTNPNPANPYQQNPALLLP